jgi:hypothetical protein
VEAELIVSPTAGDPLIKRSLALTPTTFSLNPIRMEFKFVRVEPAAGLRKKTVGATLSTSV